MKVLHMQSKKYVWMISLGAALTVLSGTYAVMRGPAAIKLDNAFVVGRVIRIAAPKNGTVEAINLARFDTLANGKIAFLVSDRSSADQVRSAQMALSAAFSEAGQSCMRLGSQVEQVKLSKLTLDLAEERASDARKLFDRGFVSQRQIEQQLFDTRKAGVALQVAQLEQRRLEMESSSAVPGSSKVVAAIEQLRQALIEQQRGIVRLHGDIFVYDIHVLPGQWVEEGAQLATVIPIETMRIQANILESQIGQVAIGQSAEIRLDGLGKQQVFHGRVETIVPATAATFSQIQRNTADSTWMKVSQRIPVVIRIDDPIAPGQVHVGQSAEVALLPQQPSAPVKPLEPGIVAPTAAPAHERNDINEEILQRVEKERNSVSRRLRLPASCMLFSTMPAKENEGR